MKKYTVINSKKEIMDNYEGRPMIADDADDLSFTAEKGEKIIEIEWDSKKILEESQFTTTSATQNLKIQPPSPRGKVVIEYN